MNRTDAARIGGMDRQTLRDGVHWFKEAGPDGLRDHWAAGPDPRLSAEHKAELAAIVEAATRRLGPIPRHGRCSHGPPFRAVD